MKTAAAAVFSDMEAAGDSSASKASSLRWRILRRAILPHDKSQSGIRTVSRKATNGFNLIPFQLMHEYSPSRDARLCYALPIDGSPKLVLTSKRIIELGSGYGLAGFAAATEALEVVISDGNPQVVDYIQHNIDANSGAFGCTKVKSTTLHWNQDEISELSNTFDVIVASDCTFFKEFHKSLARIVQCLLKNVRSSQAIFFSPKSGDSLDKFLEEIKETGLRCSVTETMMLKFGSTIKGS